MRVPLDASTPTVFDNAYFQNLGMGKGLFTSDAALLTDARTLPIVQEYSRDQRLFFANFVGSMVAMGRIGALTGPAQGEIRRHCSSVN
jgi:peroxidase